MSAAKIYVTVIFTTDTVDITSIWNKHIPPSLSLSLSVSLPPSLSLSLNISVRGLASNIAEGDVRLNTHLSSSPTPTHLRILWPRRWWGSRVVRLPRSVRRTWRRRGSCRGWDALLRGWCRRRRCEDVADVRLNKNKCTTAEKWFTTKHSKQSCYEDG